ncbi:MAG TPA: glycosyl transferase family 1 [Rhodothermales bacterium]|nr:glycosyl transferase family 1 [Rhodothermales bacterium]
MIPETPHLRVLVIAYYFPPMGGSGVQRITKFVKYLTQFGWEPEVLTVEPQGYYAYDESLMEEIPDVPIHRVASKDLNRLFKKGTTITMPGASVQRKWSWLSGWAMIPDSKIGWKADAVEAGKKILDNKRFDMIFSTAPPFTVHLVAMELSQYSGVPFIADFREPWLDNSRLKMPTQRHKRKHLELETEVVKHASRLVTINRGIKEGLIQRHTGAGGYNTIQIIPHGFDPEDFPVHGTYMDGIMRFVYSGMFYDVQKPDTFLHAFQDFINRRPDAAHHVLAEFVGLTPEGGPELVQKLKLEDHVVFEGYIPHRLAVQKIWLADVLWMTLGDQPHVEKMSTSKLYEYFGTQKPILGLVPEGEEAHQIRAYGAGVVVEPNDIRATSRAIEQYYDLWRKRALPRPDVGFVERFDRRLLTRELAKVMSGVLMQMNEYYTTL